MAKVIAIANQKGGVTKTTTTNSFAACLKKCGKKVLTIDIDPQGNLTDSIGADGFNSPTIYELLKREITINEAIQHLSQFDIVPANIMLAGAEMELSQIGKEQRLKEMIAPVIEDYDYIVIDTPPSLGVLTINAFTCADEIIIPTTASIYAVKGIQQLYDTITNVQKYCNPNVQIAGILITRYSQRMSNNKQMKELTEKIAAYISAPVYNTYIRNSVVIEESQARSLDVFNYKETSEVAKDYKKFTYEYLGLEVEV